MATPTILCKAASGGHGGNRRSGSPPVVLTFVGHYLPGYKAGGPLRSLVNLTKGLDGQFAFRIVTSDRDLGDRQPYVGIRSNVWQKLGNAQVMYLSPGRRWWNIFKVLYFGDYDVVYLNSYFDRTFSMLASWLRPLGVFPDVPWLLAPRGEFSPGAMRLKKWRKSLYVWLTRKLGLYDEIVWHASTTVERNDIIQVIGPQPAISLTSSRTLDRAAILIARPLFEGRIVIASDLAIHLPDLRKIRPPKLPGHLEVVFISRIARKKNLDTALRILSAVQGRVNFTVYGPIEEARYWAECESLIKSMPSNICVTYRGDLTPDQVMDAFRLSNLFLFPTYGENYGHVIIEALVAGCPVLLSDQTPWRRLEEAGIGWEYPLERLDQFRATIDACVRMNNEEFIRFSQRAMEFGCQQANSSGNLEDNRSMFRKLCVNVYRECEK
jgi:glycosyltransferase involved in cell wall biosynthesis